MAQGGISEPSAGVTDIFISIKKRRSALQLNSILIFYNLNYDCKNIVANHVIRLLKFAHIKRYFSIIFLIHLVVLDLLNS